MRVCFNILSKTVPFLKNTLKNDAYEKILVIRGLSPHGLRNFKLIGLFFILWVILIF